MTAAALDERILGAVAAWRAGEDLPDAAFDALALALFAYQIGANDPYRRFAAAAGFSPQRMPAHWGRIPAVPSSAFKDATLATFDPARAELTFRTSGTTAERTGVHYMARAAIYDEVLCAGFERFMLPPGQPAAFFNLVPDPAQNPHSSLGYMMRRAGERFGAGPPRFYLRGDRVDVEALARDIAAATARGTPAMVAGTAFAFAALLEDLGGSTLSCAPGSRVMETGGFKGRTRAVGRADLYAGLARAFAVPECDVVAEYGMTELTSQYYDAAASRTAATRVKTGPPWLRCTVVDGDGRELPAGETGFLRHVDLANRSSVVAIVTEDRGYAVAGGFVLLGRDETAPLRGCSLDQEDLLVRRG